MSIEHVSSPRLHSRGVLCRVLFRESSLEKPDVSPICQYAEKRSLTNLSELTEFVLESASLRDSKPISAAQEKLRVQTIKGHRR